MALVFVLCSTMRGSVAFHQSYDNLSACNEYRRMAKKWLVLKAATNSEEVRAKLLDQIQKLREKDRHTKVVDPEDLKIVYEDKCLVVVDKPTGVLSVASEEGIPCLAQAVFERVENSFSSYDRMVIHRLGTETSGLIVFAKTMETLRSMNTLFRTRQVIRKYEVLVCGHVVSDEGTIDMPLMRDYMYPPYMKISTDEHQRALLGLDPAIVGKKLLQAPKPSQTQYNVLARETLGETELPVTRLTVTCVTGRTHQLHVHLAGFGHPIVGDLVYGIDGEAAPNGGLGFAAIRDDAADIDVQKAIAQAASGMSMCVHAKYLQFRHPTIGEFLEFKSPAPF